MTTNCALYGILFSWTLFEYTFSKYLVTYCALIWFNLSWTVWICFWKASFRECLWSQSVHCRKEQNINFHRRPKIWAWTFGHRSRSRSLKTFGFGRSLRPSVDLCLIPLELTCKIHDFAFIYQDLLRISILSYYSNEFNISSCFSTLVWLVSRSSPAKNISSTIV